MKTYCINLTFLRGLFKHSLKFISIILLITLLINLNKYVSDNYIPTNVEADIGKVIIIDAGHGGEDSGAIGVDGVLEKDLNLNISVKIAEILMEKGYTVVLTRTEDKMLYKDEENIKGMRKLSDLKNRCKFAENYDDSLFVSIHMNSFGASKYSGLQVYYSDDNDESYNLASKIQTSVKSNLQTSNNRTVKNGKGLYILDNCKSTSVIIECGFLTNPDECKKLSEKEYQNQLSFAIVCGIIEYIEQSK